ncbi:N-acetyl-gamma-glutamyl-phosphate reductase [Geothermobacter hydrogeniphilus]|uniref:N-acetyl-gamma-glutamyl-phosphate reductase n=1 Tax=Geothermobacter hydrogeniphilus TaxID=1969733 RepID=A0A2K2H909_9BACT|nr:N-acetyl-gamma-glutamyl-phosphate reductase [Geothermobacter hydrogeniphilus]PNU19802.1 N-acetyl-gamma-glutamyl-phosphate reductase [Geothermobacter hydrogeniphilus]
MNIKVAVVGASGYTGVELLRLLVGHPHTELVCVTSRQFAGQPVARVFPSLAGRCELVFENLAAAEIAARAEIVLTALPHQAAMAVIPDLLVAGCRVVDLSADYRLRDAAVYEHWYQPHSSPQLLAEAAYGLPELFREQVRPARLVANPGCYPTSVALGLAPLLRQGVIDPDSLIIDSKSGTSGAGRGAKLGSLFCEVNEGFKAYGVAGHRHTPEIEQTLSILSGREVKVSFTPHLLPVSRGILSTCYAASRQQLPTAELVEIYRQFYADEYFVRVHPVGSLPNINQVAGSNYCDLGVVADERTGRIIVVSVIDNLVKGAAGQAVQNLNLLAGLPEQTGLEALSAFP